MSSSFLEISHVTKSFPGPQGPAVIVQDFDLRIESGEFISIIGHSGCGKSTVLAMLAGLSEPTLGGIILAGRELDGPGLDRGVVFQAPCLLPWLSALENVQLAVDQVARGRPRSERRAAAIAMLERVGLRDALHQRPAELSQGMRQRVGLARAFALHPKLLLLDEPFGMVDSLTRYALQDVLVDLWGRDRKTAVMITHDVDEALFLSDRIVLMSNGPAATIQRIVRVPFPRPRDRRAFLEDASYHALREHLLGLLDGHAPVATSAPPKADATLTLCT